MQTPYILNDDFKYVLDKLEKSKSNMFITGRAGTGKSTLLQLFKNLSRQKIVVLAPTGVAALNVQGQTIHSFFGFPARLLTDREARKKVTFRQQARLYKSLEIMVIDEISMVRADVLDAIDIFLRVNRENPLPFGGVQVVFFGDLYQLPPIVKRDPVEMAHFNGYYDSQFFFSAKVMKEESLGMEMVELRQVFRQESRFFLRLLEAVRMGEIDHDDLEDLNKRHVQDFEETEGYITLSARNAAADAINKKRLEILPGPEVAFPASVKGQFDPSQYPTEDLLNLRNGAQVMFLKNDPDKRFVNGTIGKIIRLTSDSVRVETLDKEGKPVLIDVEPMEWEILRYRADDGGKIDAEVIGSFKQLPLRLAWAITIHKSQGKTFDRIIIELGDGAFEHGQLYVALSRCRTLEGIVLKRPIQFKDIITDERIIDFYNAKF